MFQHQGVWLPEGELHFPLWMTKNGEVVNGRGTYQIKKLRVAVAHCQRRRTAVDVGGHVGLWSMHLAHMFGAVHAFEPMGEFRQCFVRNVTEPNVLLYPCALGSERKQVFMRHDPKDSGGTHVDPVRSAGDVQMHTLDEFDLSEVDFLKLDCEGYEHLVLQGARETIVRWEPVIIVEQKPHKLGPNFGITGTPAVTLLQEMGYKVSREMGGDYIMTKAPRA